MNEKQILLEVLPIFNNERWILAHDQEIEDIVKEVKDAHEYFKHDYDRIYEFFDTGDTEETCKLLFDFCKRNIGYKVETEDDQTTASPGAILMLGKGDCKHYAGFIGGVLGAINRNTRHRINWFYRFASYSLFDKDVGHVFVVVNDRGNEIWIDPVLCCFDSRSVIPSFKKDKKVDMLSRISGLGMIQAVVPFSDDYLSSAAVTKTITVPEVVAQDVAIDPSTTTVPNNIIADIQLLMYEGIIQSDGVLNFDTYKKVSAGLQPADQEKLYNTLIEFYDYMQNNQSIPGNQIGDIWSTIVTTIGTIATSILGGNRTSTSGISTDQLIQILNAEKSTAPSLTTYLPYILIGGAVLFLVMSKK